jgi:Holliday junction resolvasome RuvABC endonuclease subunit
MNDKRYVVGCDPGFGETGLVLYLDDAEQNILEWATFKSPPGGRAAAARAASLAEHVINEMVTWIERHDIQLLDIGIELPIFGRNVASYQKQMRVVQEIESGLLFRVSGEVQECWVTEVLPNQSKLLACNYGGATKAEIIMVSPFTSGYNINMPQATIEAVADAWAHGLATWGVMGGRFSLSSVKASKIVRRSDKN